MKRIRKFRDFMDFVVRYKLPKLVRHMTLQELSELCCASLSGIDPTKQYTLLVTGMDMLVVHTVETELKRRYPYDVMLQHNTDFSKPEEVARILEKLGGLSKDEL